MKNCIKSLAIIIAFSIILSSCSVYYKKEASLNEVYLSEKPVRLLTNENKKVFLKKIILKDSAYYGVYMHNGNEITFPLSKETYRSIRMKNRPVSTILTVTTVVLTVGIVGLFIAAVSIGNIGGGWGAPGFNEK